METRVWHGVYNRQVYIDWGYQASTCDLLPNDDIRSECKFGVLFFILTREMRIFIVQTIPMAVRFIGYN